MFFWGWVPTILIRKIFLKFCFLPFRGNYGEYSNTEADNLLELAAVEINEEISTELYRQAEQILINDAACIPLYFDRNYILVKPYVIGYELNALGMVKLNEVYLEIKWRRVGFEPTVLLRGQRFSRPSP